jgi:ATP-binding cassette, subfamily B, bacterial
VKPVREQRDALPQVARRTGGQAPRVGSRLFAAIRERLRRRPPGRPPDARDPARGGTYPVRRLYWRLVCEARPYARHIGGLFVLSLLSSALALLMPLPLKIAVDSVVGSHPLPGILAAVIPAPLRKSQTGVLLVAAGLFLVISALRQLQEFGSLVLTTYTGEKLLLQFRSRLFRHAERLSLAYHDARGTADSAYRIQYDAMAIQTVAVASLVPIFTATVTVAGMVYVTARIDWQLALVALTIAPVLFVEMRVYRKRLRNQWHDAKRLESSALSVVQESLAALRVLKAFGREDHARDRFADRSAASVRAKVSVSFAEGRFGLLVGTTIGLGMGCILFLGTRSVLAGAMTLGELVLVVGYLQQLYDPLKTASKKAGSLQSSLASAERVYSVLDQSPDFSDPPDALPLPQATGAVAFRNVGFAYEPGPRVLDGISFEIQPGTRLGIAGTTGAGKTTLISLLARFYDPGEGQILLDGVDLRRYKLADLRNQFAIVLQEPVLFSASIAENIAYGRPGADSADVVAAARAASAHDFISALPEGYATPVGERGVRLSGGERQRIGLARAFLKDAPILILDEPTSSVDARTEAEILDAMRRLMRGRTTFMIAHRASTLKSCNARLQLDHGRMLAFTPPGAHRVSRARRPVAGRETRRAGSPARQVVGHVPVTHPSTHPAVRAWRTIAPATHVDRVDQLRAHKRAQIYRLALKDGRSVIAKCGQREAISAERTIYDKVLPRMPSLRLRNIGFVSSGEEERPWLFIEDAGDDWCSLAEHGRLAAYWLGTLHGCTAELGLASLLPERGPGHYLERLRAARTVIIESMENPALHANDRILLRELVSACELVESSWDGIDAMCTGLPRTLVHGDLVAKNLRLLRGGNDMSIAAFTWEWSGFGVPAADVHLLAANATRQDLLCYRSTISEYVGGVDDDRLQALLFLGKGFRLFAAIDWASAHLPHPWPQKGVATLRTYEQPLQTWLSELENAA